MKVVDAPNLAEAEASYAISGQGIIDYKCEGCSVLYQSRAQCWYLGDGGIAPVTQGWQWSGP